MADSDKELRATKRQSQTTPTIPPTEQKRKAGKKQKQKTQNKQQKNENEIPDEDTMAMEIPDNAEMAIGVGSKSFRNNEPGPGCVCAKTARTTPTMN